MIIIKNNTLERISSWTKDSIYVLADFDFTLTSKNSTSTWGILEKSTFLHNKYKEERNQLFKQYRPIEYDESIPNDEKRKHMHDWWEKALNLFIKYKVTKKIIEKESSNPNVMSFRQGAKEFLEKLHQNNIPIIIISAGVGNFIEAFLQKNNCYYDNIHIISNFLDFKDGLATGIKSHLIHSHNKNEVSLSSEVKEYISNRKNIILLGDNIGDTYMTSDKDALKIGFLEENIDTNQKYYEQVFDLVCINSDFDEVLKTISIL